MEVPEVSLIFPFILSVGVALICLSCVALEAPDAVVAMARFPRSKPSRGGGDPCSRRRMATAGRVRSGKASEGPTFGWDLWGNNEGPRVLLQMEGEGGHVP